MSSGSSSGNFLERLIGEIHRRSLWQVLAIYVAAGWVVFEVVQTLTEGLGLPNWFPSLAFVLLLIGLPVVLATAFVQEGGPGRDAGATVAELEEIFAAGESSAAEDRGGGIRALFTWRNATLGGIVALALWGVLATGWIVFGDEGPGARSDPSLSRPSLAVLPFDNLSPDPDNAYFSAGVHEEILTELSRISGIKLISRTSVLRYDDSEKSLSQIAEELGVSTILEGSVRRAGDEVRITTQLIDASTDEHLWAESYERELSDIFQIQAEVATRVVEELRGVLTPEERVELAERPTDDLEAYAHYLRGHEHLRRSFGSEEARRAAADAYQRAVDRDSTFADAWVRLVETRLWLAWVRRDFEEREQARTALERLETLAPESPQLRLARALWLHDGEERYREALREFEALAETWPGDVKVMERRSSLYRRMGRWDDAVRTMERIFVLDPADANRATSIAQTYLIMRRFDETERYARIAVSLEPEDPFHWGFLIWGRLSRGDTAAARSAVDSAGRHLGEEALESRWAWGWALFHYLMGDREEVLDLYRVHPFTYTSMPDLGIAVAAAQGDRELAQIYADTLRNWARRMLSSAPTEYTEVRSQALAHQALAEAYLGDAEEAVRLADEAVRLYPVFRDAFGGPDRVLWQAHVYAAAGRHDEAVDRLRYLFSIPAHMVTAPQLRMDVRWDPLRDHPGFQGLLEEYGSG